jgi:AcrR family transcriptional regulator
MASSFKSRSKFRRTGNVRRSQLLDATRKLLDHREPTDISLRDVAKAAKIPASSAYHFYQDILDLYVQLVGQIDKEMLAEMQKPVTPPLPDWQAVVEQNVRRAAAFFSANAAARKLIIGPDTPPAVKLTDRSNDVTIGKLLERQIDEHFVLPVRKTRSAIFFRAVEIADLLFTLSMLEHARITPGMAREAVLASTGYLRMHFPDALPRRNEVPAAKAVRGGARRDTSHR